MRMMRTVAMGIALISLGSCSTEDKRPLQPPVEVHGVLRMTGGPAGATQPGVAGRVTFVGPHDDDATMDIPTKADGTFSLELNPGVYTITGHSPQFGDGKDVCRAAGEVRVKSGSNAAVTVSCNRR